MAMLCTTFRSHEHGKSTPIDDKTTRLPMVSRTIQPLTHQTPSTPEATISSPAF